MTLVDRVSSFFLAALAGAFVACSALIYFFVANDRYHHFDDHLRGSFHTLVAAVEVEDDDVKWEPLDHTITVGADRDVDAIKWAVLDDAGRIVDHSRNFSLDSPEDCELIAGTTPDRAPEGKHFSAEVETTQNDAWRRLQRRLAAPHAKPAEERDPAEYPALTVVAGRSPSEIRNDLRSLGLALVGVPIVAWLIAAILGRGFVRRALRPVREMADRAASPATADFRLRLPVAPTNDELSQLGSAFNRLLDQLQQAFERQQRFTGDAAHQLRTPLTVLMGELDVTLRRPRSPEEYVRTMTLLREQTSELQQLVESLLFLARAEHDAVPPDLRMLDLHSWLPARLDRWRSHPRGADVQFDAALGDRAPLVVRASPELLGQIIDNLVGNALKYSPAGTPVVVSARREEAANRSQAVIAVLDEGQGVAEADREAIFEPFIRTESARRSGAPGAGLGLAVAARIAAALHGRLRCEGREGPGSRFVLTLPLHHATANGLPSAITSA